MVFSFFFLLALITFAHVSWTRFRLISLFGTYFNNRVLSCCLVILLLYIISTDKRKPFLSFFLFLSLSLKFR